MGKSCLTWVHHHPGKIFKYRAKLNKSFVLTGRCMYPAYPVHATGTSTILSVSPIFWSPEFLGDVLAGSVSKKHNLIDCWVFHLAFGSDICSLRSYLYAERGYRTIRIVWGCQNFEFRTKERSEHVRAKGEVRIDSNCIDHPYHFFGTNPIPAAPRIPGIGKMETESCLMPPKLPRTHS